MKKPRIGKYVKALSFTGKRLKGADGRWVCSKWRTSGVYALRSPEGRMYVGGTLHVSHRWTRHVLNLSRGTHKNRPLQEDWDRVGGEGFEFCILSECTAQTLRLEEQLWIDKLGGVGGGYNICLRVDAPPSTKGRRHSQAWRDKVIPELVARTRSAEGRKAAATRFKRLWATPEFREKQRIAAKRSWTEERKKRASAATAAYWNKRRGLAVDAD